MFAREHNRLCEKYEAENPSWTDEQLYQHARKIVGGIIQAIVYEEWLPTMGVHYDDYGGYDDSVNPGIMNVFSSAAYRYGHSVINSELIRMDNDGYIIPEGNVLLKDAFFNPGVVVEGDGGLSPFMKGMATQIEQDFDINVFQTEETELPSNEEELQLFMQLKYKPAIEIAAEEAVDTILNQNQYQETRKRCDYDLMTLGVSMAKHQFLPGQGIQIDYVDPANVVYSYTEDPYFKDCFYWGEVKTVPMTELVKIDPNISNEDMNKISKYSQSWYNYYNTSQYNENSMFYRDTCTLLYFNYKTTHTFVYKKKQMADGTFKVVAKDDTFNPPQEMMDEGSF